MADHSFSWGRAIKARLLWFPLIPLFAALIFLGVGQILDRQAAQLEAYGLDTVATVLDRRTETRRGNDGTRHTVFRIELRFYPSGGGAPVIAWRDVGSQTYDAARIGTTLPVRYVAHDPATFEVEPGSTGTVGFILGLVGFLFLLIGIGLALFLGRDLPQVLRAHRRGIWRVATVQGYQETSVRVNGTNYQRIVWQDPTGAVGESRPHNPATLPAVGAPVDILLDQDSGTSWWSEDI